MYYVYLHKKPNGEVFYVGKGKGSRAYSPHGRNPYWKAVVNKHGYFVEIVQSGLQEWYAYELEELLTYYYGLKQDGGTLVNLCYGGGGNNGYLFTDDVKSKISEKVSGIANGRSDKNIYTFVRLHDNLEETCTRQDFTYRYNISIADLFKGKVLTCLGWTIKENLSKITCIKYDAKLYTFINNSGEIIVATRRDFKIKTGIDPKGLFKGLKYRNKSVKGWSLQD